jgi:hypothetical protein
MPKNEQELLIAKRESGGYGVDPSPDGTNAMEVWDLDFDPDGSQEIIRRLVKPTFGNVLREQVLRRPTISFKFALAGAGAAGSVPNYGPILRACCHSETVTAGTKVEYSLVDTAEESAALWFNRDGTRHKITGFRGTVDFFWPPNAIPYAAVAGMGLYAAPDESALPSPTWTGWQSPLAVSSANTPTFTIHTVALVLQNLEYRLGLGYVFRDLAAGTQRVDYTGERATEGTVVFEEPAFATFNAFTKATTKATGAMQIIHGTAAGNIVQMDWTKVQLMRPKPRKIDRLGYLEMAIAALENAGNDEHKLTVK